MKHFHLAHCIFGVFHDRPFGQLELEMPSLEPERLEDTFYPHYEIMLLELCRRQIYRHMEIEPTAFVPISELTGSVVERPLTEKSNSSGLLGNWNEAPGRNTAQAGVSPTNQRFRADHVPFDINEGLVEQFELVETLLRYRRQRLLDLRFLAKAVADGVVIDNIASTTGLAFGKSNICVAEELFFCMVLPGVEREAEVTSKAYVFGRWFVWTRDRIHDALGHEIHRVGIRHGRENQEKLIEAVRLE